MNLKRVLVGCGLLLMTCRPSDGAPAPAYRFAPGHTTDDLLTNAAAREAFVKQVLYWESRFLRPGIAYDEKTGLTYDGHAIDATTGELTGEPRAWSAASKEALHVLVESLAVAGRDDARYVRSPDHPAEAPKIAVAVLDRKIRSYEAFQSRYPGFAGFLPWFELDPQGMRPAERWELRLPALDNGEWAFALYLAYHTLEDAGYEDLAARYKRYFTRLASNAVPVFYDARTGKIRAVSTVSDPRSAQATYSGAPDGDSLDDAFEGEIMVVFMSLFGQWPDPDSVARVWRTKRMEATELKDPVRIRLVRGCWKSSHECWNLLQLPYLDLPTARPAFLNGEKARTWGSVKHRWPGLLASTHRPEDGNQNPPYESAVGIPELATVATSRTDSVAPYAAFPVILADRKTGIAWLHRMLLGNRVQGPYGMTESISADGRRIAPLLTWDGKMTVVLALLGGAAQPVAEALKQDGKYEQFRQLVDGKYKETFGEDRIPGEDVPFALPTAHLPADGPEFTPGTPATPPPAVASPPAADLLEKALFEGGGVLNRRYRFKDGDLHLPVAPGYIWSRCAPVDLEQSPVILVEANTRGGGVFVELKNSADTLITKSKVLVDLPDTKKDFQTFACDLAPLLGAANRTTAILAFSDVTGSDIHMKSVKCAAAAPADAIPLAYDGRRFCLPALLPRGGVDPDAFPNMLTNNMNFAVEGLQVERKETLVMHPSSGWISSAMPATDLAAKPILTFIVRTREPCQVAIELKNRRGIGIVGIVQNNVFKLPLQFPVTKGQWNMVSFNLAKHYTTGAKNDRVSTVMAFSEVSGGPIEILSIGFEPVQPKGSILIDLNP